MAVIGWSESSAVATVAVKKPNLYETKIRELATIYFSVIWVVQQSPSVSEPTVDDASREREFINMETIFILFFVILESWHVENAYNKNQVSPRNYLSIRLDPYSFLFRKKKFVRLIRNELISV